MEWFGDLWDYEADVRCITTNGTVRPDSRNIMGGGCAREAAERYPWLPKFYGRMIEEHGHHVYLIGNLIMFPTKHNVQDNADLALIGRSCIELMQLVKVYGWTRIALPAPGCGLGGLSWEDEVRPYVNQLLDTGRVTFVRYPSERSTHDQ